MTVAVATAAIVLAGCAAMPTPTPPASTPTPTVAAVPLGCGLLLPVDLAATALGLPADTLFDPATRVPDEQQPYAGAVSAAMIPAASMAGGLVSCSYSAPDNGTGEELEDGSHRPPSVGLAVLPNSADEYSVIEPDADDGLNGFVSTPNLGDKAFITCHPPEVDSCRAEILVGTTWISAGVTPRPEDATFLTFARAVVAAAEKADSVPATSLPKAVGCDALLTPGDLSGAVGIQNSKSTDYGAFPSRMAGIGLAADRHAGFVQCGWLTSDSGDGTSTGVLARILPEGKGAWDGALPDAGSSIIQFSPVAGLGDEAYAGCAESTCEVDVLAGDVWLSLQVNLYPDPSGLLDGAKTLAGTVLANYLANR